jgi:hypothetical protein
MRPTATTTSRTAPAQAPPSPKRSLPLLPQQHLDRRVLRLQIQVVASELLAALLAAGLQPGHLLRVPRRVVPRDWWLVREVC